MTAVFFTKFPKRRSRENENLILPGSQIGKKGVVVKLRSTGNFRIYCTHRNKKESIQSERVGVCVCLNGCVFVQQQEGVCLNNRERKMLLKILWENEGMKKEAQEKK